MLEGAWAKLVLQAVAVNGVASSVSIVHRDIGLLQRGRDVQALGGNIAVADMFDAGMQVMPAKYALAVDIDTYLVLYLPGNMHYLDTHATLLVYLKTTHPCQT